MLSRWSVGVVLLFAILLLLLPSRDEKSLSRIGSASMLACTSDLRDAVEKQLLAGRTVTASFRNGCPDLIASLTLNEEGEMVITGNKHPVTMRLSPIEEDGKIRWSCQGKPEDRVTKFCKP